VFQSLKDPEWEAPVKTESKSKTSIGGKGQADNNGPPPVVHIPIEVERAMHQKVQKASLLEGERPLPEAGLIYFQHRGKVDKIHSLELIYSGPGGKASLNLK